MGLNKKQDRASSIESAFKIISAGLSCVVLILAVLGLTGIMDVNITNSVVIPLLGAVTLSNGITSYRKNKAAGIFLICCAAVVFIICIVVLSFKFFRHVADSNVESNTIIAEHSILGRSKVSDFQTVSEDDIIFQEDFVIPDFETLCADDNSTVTESRDFFTGSETNWYTIENNGIIYFFYQYLDSEPISEPDYLNYAIVGEQYKLKCGIHVGMTEEEVYALLPGCVSSNPGDSKGTAGQKALSWNVSSFPDGWCESYAKVIVANIEYGEEFPWYLGIMLDENGIVRAITTCYPTAG